MMNGTELERPTSQSGKFKDAVRAAERDGGETRWQERLKHAMKHKPVPEKPE
jgi:hypothetical protein